MIPGIIFSFLTMLMTILFPLTEAKMKDVRRQLDERHHVHPETAPDIE
jgi:Na+/melibiose symporter-like transporter